MLNGLADTLAGHSPFCLVQHFHLGPVQHVGHPYQCLHPVNLPYLVLTGKVLQLLIIALHQCRVDGAGNSRLVLLDPDAEINLAAQQLLGYHLTNLHLFLTIERSNAGCQIQLLGVE